MTRSGVIDAVLVVEVDAPAASVRSPHEAAFALLGTFAEASTHVVETVADVGREVELLATTGMLAGDGALRTSRPRRAHHGAQGLSRRELRDRAVEPVEGLAEASLPPEA